MSGEDLDRMTPEEIREWAERERAKSRAAFAGRPLPEISRVKRDDYPHWEVTSYEFHTRSGEQVLVGRGEEPQVEGTLGGVRPARGQDELLVELEGELWACTRADGRDWAPKDTGRVRVETLTVAVLARRAEGPPEPQEWTLQTNMEGQP